MLFRSYTTLTMAGNNSIRPGGYGGFYENDTAKVGSSSNLSQRSGEGYTAASRSREDLSLRQAQRRPSGEARRPRERGEAMPPPEMPAARDYGRRPSNARGGDGARSYSSSRHANGSGTNLVGMNSGARPPMPKEEIVKVPGEGTRQIEGTFVPLKRDRKSTRLNSSHWE